MNNRRSSNIKYCRNHGLKYQGMSQQKLIGGVIRSIDTKKAESSCDLKKIKEHCNIIELEVRNVFHKGANNRILNSVNGFNYAACRHSFIDNKLKTCDCTRHRLSEN